MNAEREQSPTNTRTRHALSLMLGAGMLVSLNSGCENRRTARDDEPTNAGLAALTEDDNAPVLGDPDDGEFDATRAAVLESARLLEETFANAEPSGTGDETDIAISNPELDAMRAELGVNNDPVNLIPDEPWGSPVPDRARPIASTDFDPPQDSDLRPVPVEPVSTEPASNGDGGTRFSLGGAMGETSTDVSSDETVEDRPFEPSETVVLQPDLAVAEAIPEAPMDPETRKQQLAEELVQVLADLARTGDAPGSAALALAGLETLQPAALDQLRDAGVLSDTELATLDATRELFSALYSEGGIADPAQVSDTLDRIRRELDARAGLRIARAELCTRVLGFGDYEVFPANRFVAGRAQPVIIYAEMQRFGHRETTGPDGQPRFEIEMSQRLELYHTADDLNTWNRASETDRSTSRNRVRDYYLINQVTLPSNLTVGKYHLKVIMKDAVLGNTAEAIIPIEIVAG